MKILIRNLSRKLSEEQLFDIFKPFGEISACNLVIDNETGLSKGFGFIEMPVLAEAKKAITTLNGKKIRDSVVRVKEANA